MLLTFILVVLIGLTAFGVSSLANKRRPDGPSVPRSVLPHQLDRADFLDPNCEWALLLFTSDSCEACEIASAQVSKVSQSNLMVQSIEFPEMEVLHKKYAIHSVPSLLLADREGVVQWSFAGVPPIEALIEALTHLRIIPPENGQIVDIS